MYAASAVIPTTGRPELVRAVSSVLQQTVRVEPIVVLDNPELLEDVSSMLDGLPHKMILTSGRVGGAEARNIGVDNANADVIGFLDDDDEWLPQKTKYQLAELRGNRMRVITSKSLIAGRKPRIVPRKPYTADTTMATYLATRDTLRLSNNFMQTSSVMMYRSLSRQIPWNPVLPRHQDWALFIDLEAAGAEFVSRPEVLVRVHQGSAGSVSRSNAWQSSLDWIERYGTGAAPKSRADFLAAIALRSALRSREWKAARRISIDLLRSRPHLAAAVVGVSGVLGK